MEIKVGDRVKIIEVEISSMNNFLGTHGTVIRIAKRQYRPIKVVPDIEKTEGYWSFSSTELKLVPYTKTKLYKVLNYEV